METKKEFKRGDVALVNLEKRNGSIQWGQRPVLVISNNKNNQFSSIISVIPLTTSAFKKRLPTHVSITRANSDIEKDSIALCEQILLINKDDIIKPLFTLSDELMGEINNGLAIQLDLHMVSNNRMAYAM